MAMKERDTLSYAGRLALLLGSIASSVVVFAMVRNHQYDPAPYVSGGVVLCMAYEPTVVERHGRVWRDSDLALPQATAGQGYCPEEPRRWHPVRWVSTMPMASIREEYMIPGRLCGSGALRPFVGRRALR